MIDAAILLDEEDTEYWNIVYTLHQRATSDVLEAAVALCKSTVSAEKVLGCNIIARLGEPDKPFLRESISVLCDILEHEEDTGVLTAAIAAVGWLDTDNKRVLHPLVDLKDHPSPDVRWYLARNLPIWTAQIALDTLIALTTDENPGVRDMATFELASIVEADTPEIRKALWHRTSDEDPIVRGEALKGLAIRKDSRVVERIIRDLQNVSEATNYAIDAAFDMADTRLCEPLIALRGNPDIYADPEEAIVACRHESE